MASDYPFVTPLVSGPEGDADVEFACATSAPQGIAWEGGEPVTGPGLHADPDTPIVFARFPSHDAIRVTGSADFHTFDDRILCHLRQEAHRYLVEIGLFGMVFALWFERRGTLTLHASAVSVGGRAVAFLGNKAAGKTSAAAAHVVAGHEFLTDDLLVLGEDAAGTSAHRAFPAIRLWPEGVRYFARVEPEAFPAPHPSYTKRRVALEESGLGHFAAGPRPLERIYVLERRPTPGGGVSISDLRVQEAVMQLVRHSYLPTEVAGYGWHASRLPRLVALSCEIPVRLLSYGSDLARFPEVVAAVEGDLG